jgi:hypothetical protein
MPLTLEEYDHQIGFHVRMMAHHAKMLTYHAEQVTYQTDFENLIEEDFATLDEMLAGALGRLHQAQQIWRSKPHDI